MVIKTLLTFIHLCRPDNVYDPGPGGGGSRGGDDSDGDGGDDSSGGFGGLGSRLNLGRLGFSAGVPIAITGSLSILLTSAYIRVENIWTKYE